MGGEQNVKIEKLLEKAKTTENKKREKEMKPTPTQHVLLGQYYHSKKDLDGAINKYEKAVQLKPDRPKFHYLLANAYHIKAKERGSLIYEEKKRFLEKAYEHYSKTSSLSPKSKIAKRAKRNSEEIKSLLKLK